MIRGLHGLVYSSNAEATRAFLRDKLQLPNVDVGDGWLIFDLPEADLGVHPVGESEPAPGTHDVSFYCDDIEGTLADLRSRGVEVEDAQDHGYGYVTYIGMPGGVRMQLYQPKYEKPEAKAKPKAKAKARAKPKAKKKKKR